MKFNAGILLYSAALLTSIAAMEFSAWTIALAVAVICVIQRRLPSRIGPDAWVLSFALFSIIGILLADMPGKEVVAEIGFLRWILLLYTLSFAWMNSDLIEKPDAWVWLVAVLVGVTGLFAAFQFLTGLDPIRPNHALVPAGTHGFRARGFFSLSLTLAYVLGLAMALLMPQILRVKQKMLFGILLGLGAIGLFASLSRAPWIAIVVVVFVFAYQEFGRKAAWGLVPALAGFLGLFFFEPEFHKRIVDLFDFSTAASNGMRIDLWRGYWQVFVDHPFFGAGLFWGDEHIPAVFERLSINQPFVSHAHNNYLQALAGTGVFGFISFVGFQVYFLRAAYHLTKRLKGTDLGRIAQGIFLCQIYWQLGGLTECNFFDGEVNHSIVFTWSLLIALDLKIRHGE